jgi:hypothetical protein
MLVNYAYISSILPKAIFTDPIRYFDYFKIQSPYIDCPAIQEMYKNTFVVPMPVDFRCDFRFVDNQFQQGNSNIDSRFISKICAIKPNKIDKELQFEPLEIICWSDEDCFIETWGNNINNLTNLGGSFNIKKWIRPIHAAYLIHKEETHFNLNLKKGDPFLFIKFNSKKRVNLKYNYDTPIIDESQKMSKITLFGFRGTKKYFEKFNKIRPKKLTK